MIRKLLFALLLTTFFSTAFSAIYYVAPDGNDLATGSILLPFQTIQRAQTSVVAGDTVYIRGGTYNMTEAQIALKTGIFAYVTNLTKSGTSGNRINYWAYPGERPVFDYTTVKPANYRVNAFEVSASWLYIKGLEVTGVQVTITNANTQSICFDNVGSNNIYEQLSMHDGQAIGFYLTKGANNLILNCDAYRNNDYTSLSGGGVNGGNVDGFGNHPTNAGNINNVYKGCRAWFNSDDGYDCITADESTLFDSCWSFYNGYTPGFISRGDGNGFKAGGYGSTVFTSLPANIPRNTVRFCLSVRNKSNGFYSNHHLSGSDWYNNTAYMNSANYNMLNRKAKTEADYLTDVPGYDHVLKNNISLSPRSSGSDIISYDPVTCVITNNTFLNAGITVSANDFLSVDTALLVAPRQADGSLPKNDFMRLKPTSNLVDKGVNIGFPYNGAAPDLGCFETTNSTLPLNIVSFTAAVISSDVLLKWQVATEVQNKGWDVERLATSENNTWKKIGFVSSTGNNLQLSNYSFTDYNVPTGAYQYRLKQIDLDGNIRYSNIQLIKIEKASVLNLSVYPNPVVSATEITYNLPAKTKVHLALYNSFGQLIKTFVDQNQEAGFYKKKLEIGAMKNAGNYVLKLTAGSTIITKSLTVAKL